MCFIIQHKCKNKLQLWKNLETINEYIWALSIHPSVCRAKPRTRIAYLIMSSFLLKVNINDVRVWFRCWVISTTSCKEISFTFRLPHNVATARTSNYLVFVTCKLRLASWTRALSNCRSSILLSKFQSKWCLKWYNSKDHELEHNEKLTTHT